MAAGLKNSIEGSSARAATPAKDAPWPTELCSRNSNPVAPASPAAQIPAAMTPARRHFPICMCSCPEFFESRGAQHLPATFPMNTEWRGVTYTSTSFCLRHCSMADMHARMSDMGELIAGMQAKAAALGRLGYRLRFDLTDLDQSILVDATGAAAEIAPAEGDAEAATVLRLSSTDLARLMAGKLSPMLAFSTGRLRVEGSKGVALKLASLLDED